MAEVEQKMNVTPRSSDPKDVAEANKTNERFRKVHEMLQDPEKRSETMRWIEDPTSYNGEVTAEMKTAKQTYQAFQVISTYFDITLELFALETNARKSSRLLYGFLDDEGQ